MIQAIQLILALSFLVVIHELGHFTFARIFGVRVEKFYMFFNPKISLFRAKKFNGKWHFAFFAPNTTENDEWGKHPESIEWGIGWVPFGGYCAIAGMVDETHSSEDMAKKDPEPWEFRSKKAWQRLCIIIGGILVNFVAALLIFGALLFQWGSDTLPLRNAEQGLYYSEFLLNEGFRQQDKIIAIDNEEPEALADVVQWLIIEGKRNVTVLRKGDTLSLVMPEDLGNRYLALQQEFDRKERDKKRSDQSYEKLNYVLIGEYFPFVIDSVPAMSAASFAGIEKGDSIVSLAGVPTGSYYEAQNELRKHRCDSIAVTFFRGDTCLTTMAFIGDQGRLGVMAKSKYWFVMLEHKDYTFLESIPAGIEYGLDFLASYIKQFRLVFSKEGAQSLGGFGAIGSMFPKLWSWYTFWHMTAILSLILAFMNFLPIPALDGGYILFLLVEMITGKQPSDKFLEKANNVGFWLLIALLVFANGNDILKIFF
ncbi:MAG: site-2 protease family protein [Bacteroidales bacterium]|nr:site-2 protease family protein [Candidatus Colicola coprequi]